ncbi:glycosyltransferase family 2 protein [Paenibacillus sp. FSL K6-2524]|uniref:glycosyltransferase family 2 protein n=1 Tax=Paenibacillus sp. FSL K6-2524 TaxID=2954516 RepID=UPI0030FBA244
MRAKNKLVSIVVPVYNQYPSLMLSLKYFGMQQMPMDSFEIIVVDDGSEDELRSADEKESPFAELPYTIKIIHQENGGRAQARNTGVLHSSAECIIFCDGDRIPHPLLIKKHLGFHEQNQHGAVFGCPKDYLGKISLIAQRNEISYAVMEKYSKLPVYFKKVIKLFDETGSTESDLSWLTFLVGNSSISRKMFDQVGGFDPKFREWGFEHYDFALRLIDKNISINHRMDIVNYHIPHKRENNFYQEMIRNSIKILSKNHPHKHIELLENFLFGMISLQEFEQRYNGRISHTIRDHKPIFYKNII